MKIFGSRTCTILLVMAVVAGGVAASAEPKRKPSEYGELYSVWKAEVAALKEITPPLTSAERRTRKQEINERFTVRFRDLARRHLDDDLWISCLIWTSVEGRRGEAFDDMFDLLGDQASGARNTIQLQLLMSEFISLRSERINPALSKIAETHSDKGVRGASLYALAARTKRRAEHDGNLEACQTAEALLERVVAEYPQVSTYRGENAENAVQLLEDLQGPIAMGKPVPEMTGTMIDGSPFDLSSYDSRVLVLAFSGHWCGPCVAMHPVLKTMGQDHDPSELSIIEINSDPLDKLDAVRSRIEADELKWDVVTEGHRGPLAESWRVRAWPMYYVLDDKRHVRHVMRGNVGDELAAAVQRLLAEAQ